MTVLWIIVRQGPAVLAVKTSGDCFFTFLFSSSLYLSTARFRLKNCLKEPLNRRQLSNQPDLSSALHNGRRIPSRKAISRFSLCMIQTAHFKLVNKMFWRLESEKKMNILMSVSSIFSVVCFITAIELIDSLKQSSVFYIAKILRT